MGQEERVQGVEWGEVGADRVLRLTLLCRCATAVPRPARRWCRFPDRAASCAGMLMPRSPA